MNNGAIDVIGLSGCPAQALTWISHWCPFINMVKEKRKKRYGNTLWLIFGWRL
ncbi:MAG: hypothetical protein WD768_12260 [Phycisphaeraceae bacterium]